MLKGLAFHKSAPGLLACRGLRKISLFDLTRPQAPCLSMGGGSTFEGVSFEQNSDFDEVFWRKLSSMCEVSDENIGTLALRTGISSLSTAAQYGDVSLCRMTGEYMFDTGLYYKKIGCEIAHGHRWTFAKRSRRVLFGTCCRSL